MTQHGIWELQGTDRQNNIVRSALAACDFPFDRLLPGLQANTGRQTIPVEWADLSRFTATTAEQAQERHHPIRHDGDTAHPIEYRQQVLGLAWYSGRVSLDLTLQQDPDLAREVFLSEGGHMVDMFYMTDADRAAITAALHSGGTTEHGHGWFDVGAYEEWIGEAFMGLFIAAFAPSVSTRLTQFTHPPTPGAAAATRKLLLRQTDPTGPLAGFPYAELDAWAAAERDWWPTRNRRAAQAYKAWRAAATSR